MATVAFLGLGVMGFPMAGHLAKAGHNVTVYNRTGEKAEKWLETYADDAAGELYTAPTPPVPRQMQTSFLPAWARTRMSLKSVSAKRALFLP